mmetsp:Transcript_14166/g.33625  ORF Transcript_14166/g.33625 Transcript_14166/m.33625 type:complete len:359 (-) Transcript_14166:160-1236(-)
MKRCFTELELVAALHPFPRAAPQVVGDAALVCRGLLAAALGRARLEPLAHLGERVAALLGGGLGLHLGRHEAFLALDLAHGHGVLLLLGARGLLARVLLLRGEEVLARLELLVHLAREGLRREGRVDLLFLLLLLAALLQRGGEPAVRRRRLDLVGHFSVALLLLDRRLFELRQEALPVLALERRVLLQLAPDHERLDVVDGVVVLHAVLHYLAHLLDALEGAHSRDGVAVHEHVALREQLDRLERRAVGPNQPVAPLDETLLCAHEVADLDDVALHLILKHAQRLDVGHRAGQHLDQVPRLNDDVRVPRLARGVHGHRALDQVQLAVEVHLLERARHVRPRLADVLLAVLREEHRER